MISTRISSGVDEDCFIQLEVCTSRHLNLVLAYPRNSEEMLINKEAAEKLIRYLSDAVRMMDD